LLTLASRITGLVRELLVASTFGASAMTDAFNVAFRIPNLFRRCLPKGRSARPLCRCWPPARPSMATTLPMRLIDHVGTLLAWALLVTCVLGVAGCAAAGVADGQWFAAKPAGL
jgi:putative peptidoglycan lipid II flippase